MEIDAYDYGLPEAAIAQTPAADRAAARLLVAVGEDIQHHHVSDLPEFVRPGDVIVVNETKVLPARLRLRKATGGAAEVLLLEQQSEDRWVALVRPGRRLPPGTVLSNGDHPVVRIDDVLDDGRRSVTLLDPDVAEADGELPLPPYITTPLQDQSRYQTVYARTPGSAAAPTAGLHLTPEVLDACRSAGAEICTVDLAVGLDTFRPVEGSLADHVMHSERYEVPETTWKRCRDAERVIAVGTTTTRALESAAGGELSGRTSLFIRPGHRFAVVDVMLTNFHLPKSTLLVMLHAFMGERWRELYEVALAEGYRFLSFGDAMLVARADGRP